MKLHNQTPAWSSASLNHQLKLRRQVSLAVANYRGSTLADNDSLIPHARLRAHLVPLDKWGKPGPSCRIEVKDFDERGVTFHHPQPLHDRRALVVLEGLNLGRIAAEVDLSWCRFSRCDQYTSGGRFVQLVGKTA